MTFMDFPFIILLNYLRFLFSSSRFCFSGGRLLSQASSFLNLSSFYFLSFSLWASRAAFYFEALKTYLAWKALVLVFWDSFKEAIRSTRLNITSMAVKYLVLSL
jgi:hypothetical protein